MSAGGGDVRRVRGRVRHQLLQVALDLVARALQLVDQLPRPLRDPLQAVRREGQPRRLAAQDPLGQHDPDQPVVVVVADAAGVLVHPPDQLGLRDPHRGVRALGLGLVGVGVQTGDLAEALPQGVARGARLRDGDQVDVLRRHHGRPALEHVGRVVHPPEQLAERRRRVEALLDQVVHELLEGDPVLVLDVLLPVRHELAGEVAGGEDHVHVGRLHARDAGGDPVGARAAEQLVGDDHRRPGPVTGPRGDLLPLPGVVARALLPQLAPRKSCIERKDSSKNS